MPIRISAGYFFLIGILLSMLIYAGGRYYLYTLEKDLQTAIAKCEELPSDGGKLAGFLRPRVARRVLGHPAGRLPFGGPRQVPLRKPELQHRFSCCPDPLAQWAKGYILVF